jgi:hypothetical protein
MLEIEKKVRRIPNQVILKQTNARKYLDLLVTIDQTLPTEATQTHKKTAKQSKATSKDQSERARERKPRLTGKKSLLSKSLTLSSKLSTVFLYMINV